MSRPKNYWYGFIKKRIERSRTTRVITPQDILFANGLAKATKDTEKMQDGANRLRAVNEILIMQSADYEQVAREQYTNEVTIKRYVSDFVNLVGKYSGY